MAHTSLNLEKKVFIIAFLGGLHGPFGPYMLPLCSKFGGPYMKDLGENRLFGAVVKRCGLAKFRQSIKGKKRLFCIK